MEIFQMHKHIKKIQQQIKTKNHRDFYLLGICLFSIFVTLFLMRLQFICSLPYSLLFRFEYISVVFS